MDLFPHHLPLGAQSHPGLPGHHHQPLPHPDHPSHHHLPHHHHPHHPLSSTFPLTTSSVAALEVAKMHLMLSDSLSATNWLVASAGHPRHAHHHPHRHHPYLVPSASSSSSSSRLDSPSSGLNSSSSMEGGGGPNNVGVSLANSNVGPSSSSPPSSSSYTTSASSSSSSSTSSSSSPFLDVHKGKAIRLRVRVLVPVADHPNFNFIGKLLGPRGQSLKWLQEQTQTKMAILGKGSMRDKQKEEELRLTGDPKKYGHLHEDLHVEITAFAPAPEAYTRMGHALQEVKRFLVPDYYDDIRQQQLKELGIILPTMEHQVVLGQSRSRTKHSSNASSSSDDDNNDHLSVLCPTIMPSTLSSSSSSSTTSANRTIQNHHFLQQHRMSPYETIKVKDSSNKSLSTTCTCRCNSSQVTTLTNDSSTTTNTRCLKLPSEPPSSPGSRDERQTSVERVVVDDVSQVNQDHDGVRVE